MEQLNPSEISDIIKQRIESLDVSSEARNEGTIVSVSDGIPAGILPRSIFAGNCLLLFLLLIFLP